jgi:glycerate kinase
MSFLNAELKSGIGQVFEFLEYDRKLLNVDLIITGEGKLDGQTLGGKVIFGVANKAKENKIPIGIICGIAEEIDRVKANLDVQMIYQVFEKAKGFRDSMQHASIYVEELAKELIQSLNK